MINTGPVIDPAALSTLLRPFVRGTGSCGSGAGLGLTIVKAICDAHGGNLRLDAPPSGGLHATVALPPTNPDLSD